MRLELFLKVKTYLSRLCTYLLDKLRSTFSPGQMWLLNKAIESEARVVFELEDILVQACMYLSDKPRLTYLSWTNMAISHTCPGKHICPEQIILETKQVLFHVHVHSLDRRSKNAHDHLE